MALLLCTQSDVCTSSFLAILCLRMARWWISDAKNTTHSNDFTLLQKSVLFLAIYRYCNKESLLKNSWIWSQVFHGRLPPHLTSSWTWTLLMYIKITSTRGITMIIWGKSYNPLLYFLEKDLIILSSVLRSVRRTERLVTKITIVSSANWVVLLVNLHIKLESYYATYIYVKT